MNLHDQLDYHIDSMGALCALSRDSHINHKHIDEDDFVDKYNYYLRGEHVAWSYENIIYLQPVLPSLVEMGILAQRSKTEIPFDLPGIEVHNRLQDAVNELKNSSASYDELVKKSRVQKVREYFKYRNIAKQDVKEYNKLMKGLMR